MKVETKLKKLGFENSSLYPEQWYYAQLDVLVYVNSEGKITGVQICKCWNINIESHSIYNNYSNRDEYLIKVMKLLDEINCLL